MKQLRRAISRNQSNLNNRMSRVRQSSDRLSFSHQSFSRLNSRLSSSSSKYTNSCQRNLPHRHLFPTLRRYLSFQFFRPPSRLPASIASLCKALSRRCSSMLRPIFLSCRINRSRARLQGFQRRCLSPLWSCRTLNKTQTQQHRSHSCSS